MFEKTGDDISGVLLNIRHLDYIAEAAIAYNDQVLPDEYVPPRVSYYAPDLFYKLDLQVKYSFGLFAENLNNVGGVVGNSLGA